MLVAGAAGGVGEGIVRALLAQVPDVRVVATSRDPGRLALLAERLGTRDDERFLPLVANAGDPQGAAALAATCRERLGTLHVAIPSLGGWWEGGPFLDVDPATWARVMDEMLTTHVVFARVFVPELLRAPGGWYLGIGGGAGYNPVRNASIVSIAAAAQLMMTRSLALELRGRPIRIEELVVNGAIRTRDSEPIAADGWITAEQVGEVVAALLRGATPDWPNLRRRGPLITMDPLRRGRGKDGKAAPR